MSTRQTHVILLTLACVALPAGACPAQDERTFARGLQTVRTLMANSRWHTARGYLVDLLEEHRGAGYVRAKRAEIVENLKRCEFYHAHRRPAANRLIDGDLLEYNRASRRIVLRYRPDDLGDFGVEPTTGMRLHPLEFDGPYTITLRGPRYRGSAGGARFFVCMTKGTTLDVLCGARRVADQAIFRRAGEVSTELSPQSAANAVPGQPYRLVVQVSERSVQVFYNGERIMTAGKTRGVFGRFGFGGVEFSELRIEGNASPSWLQAVVDEHMQAELARFEETFDPEATLPEWLFEKPAAAGEGPSSESDQTYPGTVGPQHVAALNRAVEALNAGEFADALRSLEDRAAREVPRPARAYLRAICLGNLGELERALAECDVACAADADFAPSHVLRARILIRMRRRAEAVTQLEAVLAAHPRDVAAYSELPAALLRLGRPARAVRWVERARELGVDVPELDQLERTLMMALRGPGWDRSYDYQSRHYHVFSDIDRRTCIEAAGVLERALEVYNAQLGTAPARGTRFRVYVFSGRQGYQAYCQNILGGTYSHTKGLYSADLKQLLIWNLADRQEMLETVRHEGFHQYLDSVMDEPPPWFNEGLAMYYEVAGDGDRARGGVVRPGLLDLLSKRPLLPLRSLLALTPATFYQDPSRNYAASWAFVQFLRETTRGRRLLFRGILRDLQRPGVAVGAARTGLDDDAIDALDRDFSVYVTDQIRKHRRTPSRPR